MVYIKGGSDQFLTHAYILELLLDELDVKGSGRQLSHLAGGSQFQSPSCVEILLIFSYL